MPKFRPGWDKLLGNFDHLFSNNPVDSVNSVDSVAESISPYTAIALAEFAYDCYQKSGDQPKDWVNELLTKSLTVSDEKGNIDEFNNWMNISSLPLDIKIQFGYIPPVENSVPDIVLAEV
ncbi:hypothetical protein ACFL1A_00485 [Patescibacteria group bacterium]